VTEEIAPKRFGKDLACLAALLLLIVFLTYRSFSSTLFYANWVAGILAVVLLFVIAVTSCCVSSAFIRASAACGGWLAFALLVSPFATDINLHVKIWLVAFFYIAASLAIVEMLFKSDFSPKTVSFVFVLVWVLVNGILLALFSAGVYVPAKRDFSGVFHDRNVFSITSLVLCAFLIGGTYRAPLSFSRRMAKAALLFLVCLMIVVSRSIAGFMGFLFLWTVAGNKSRRGGRLALFVGLLLAFAVMFLVENPITDRLARFYMAVSGRQEELRQNESAYVRLYLMTQGLALARERWAFGVGLDNARFHVKWPLRTTGSFLHNNYLDIVTSGGVVLFALYYFPIFTSLFWLIGNRKVVAVLSPGQQQLWLISLLFLCLKLIYDMTWTTYFEFGMVFPVVFAIYSTQHLKRMIIR
jgi:O-antigen ligase